MVGVDIWSVKFHKLCWINRISFVIFLPVIFIALLWRKIMHTAVFKVPLRFVAARWVQPVTECLALTSVVLVHVPGLVVVVVEIKLIPTLTFVIPLVFSAISVGVSFAIR